MRTIQIKYPDSDIERDEQVILFPTFGHRSPDGQSWKVGVSGAVFELTPKIRQKFLLKILRRIMKVDEASFGTPLFQQRIQNFLVSTERGKNVSVMIGDQAYQLQRPTKRNGHFRGWVLLNREMTRSLESSGNIDAEWLRVEILSDDQNRKIQGVARLVDSHGLSVISDIDDTIKHSNVADKRDLLRNTFLRDFRPIDGMADLYRKWQNEGAVFHYVSSSPWQLFEPLHNFIIDGQFPLGSFHLRSIRLRDPSVLRAFFARRHRKRMIILSIVRMFPSRKFVLVGDSGEKDMEIYGSIARKFPNQIEKILIRNTNGKTITSERIAKAFKNVPTSKWRFFHDASELSGMSIGPK